MFWNVSELVVFVVAFIIFCAALEIAFRLGRKHGARSNDATKSHMNALQAALLGLLALLLGFSFAMAASRFDARKTLIEEEVNAIRTAHLRAQLLPPRQQQEVAKLLRGYVASRIEFMGAGVDRDLLEAAHASSKLIEPQLWALARELTVQGSSPVITSLFIQSLNDVININQKRLAAQDNHVPEVVIYLLFAVTLGALGFIAYGYGLTGERRHVSTMIFALLITAVLTIILDLDQPRHGLIRVGDESLLRLKDTLERSAP